MAEPAKKKQPPPAEQSELADIIRRTETTSQPYNDMMRYLGMRDEVPPVKMGYIGTYGLYKHPTADKPKGEIILNPGVGAVTLTHEVMHPAMRVLREQEAESRAAGTDKQFTDAFAKILYNPDRKTNVRDSIPILDLAQKLAPEWAKKEKYRASIGELPAFAVERAAIPEGRQTGLEAPPHVDPTIATQMMILLDLAQRASTAKKPAPAEKKPESKSSR
jgi:hypothetical protein